MSELTVEKGSVFQNDKVAVCTGDRHIGILNQIDIDGFTGKPIPFVTFGIAAEHDFMTAEFLQFFDHFFSQFRGIQTGDSAAEQFADPLGRMPERGTVDQHELPVSGGEPADFSGEFLTAFELIVAGVEFCFIPFAYEYRITVVGDCVPAAVFQKGKMFFHCCRNAPAPDSEIDLLLTAYPHPLVVDFMSADEAPPAGGGKRQFGAEALQRKAC